MRHPLAKLGHSAGRRAVLPVVVTALGLAMAQAPVGLTSVAATSGSPFGGHTAWQCSTGGHQWRVEVQPGPVCGTSAGARA